MPIRVYIVEDHRVMREALIEFLGSSAGVEVCGAAEGASEALEEIPSARPSVVLMDLALPGIGGLELLGEIEKRWKIPCIVLTGESGGFSQDRQSLAHRARKAGARGFLRKGRPLEILEAIREVQEGRLYFPESPAESEASHSPLDSPEPETGM